MASQRPDFFLGDLTDIFSLEELDCSTETELYESLFDDFVDDGTVSTAIAPAEAKKEMNSAFESGNDRPAFTLQSRPALEMYPYQPATTPTPRFKKVTEDHLKILEESRQSNSTKKNTKWGIKLFQDWSTEVLGSETNFQEVTEEELDKLLVRFYAEATPKQNEKRERKLGTENAAEYHKNSMKNIRSAINRHLKNLNRNIDVVRDKSFRKSNNSRSCGPSVSFSSISSAITLNQPFSFSFDVDLTVDSAFTWPAKTGAEDSAEGSATGAISEYSAGK
ncbi:hypothetical protein ScPMuIL_002061 [Solemya velum]